MTAAGAVAAHGTEGERAAGWDSGAVWRLDPQVAMRPEPFGALAYHYGTRRLTFLRSPLLVEVVRDLGSHASASVAVEDVVPEGRRPAFLAALGRLAASGFLVAGDETEESGA